jgi:precorrin-6B methylase 2
MKRSNDDSDDNRLAPFNPTHESSIDVAINLLQLQPSDILFDLGCGDGRMILRAASQMEGMRCVGIELNESLVAKGRNMVSADRAALADRVEIRNGDVLAEMEMIWQSSPTTDADQCKLTLLDDATAVFVYLLPQGLKKVKLLLEEAAKRRRRGWINGSSSNNSNNNISASDKDVQRPALRVASYMFSIPDWTPTQVDRSGKGSCPIYLYHL